MTSDEQAINDKNGVIDNEKELLERPVFSFRLQIILGFFTFFILSVVVTIGAMIAINQIEKKFANVQTWERFLFNIEQARRWEKNYFLYGRNLEEALSSTAEAKALLDENLKKFEESEIPVYKEAIKKNLVLYQSNLLKLRQIERENPDSMPPDDIEGNLRHYGARIVNEAENLAASEHEMVFRWLQLVQKVPAYFLVFLFFFNDLHDAVSFQAIHEAPEIPGQ